MAEPRPAAEVAKELGIYLGQIYGYVKNGSVKNYKEGGYPHGKGLIVDIDEVRTAWSGRKKGPRKSSSKSSAHGRQAEAGEAPRKAKAPRTGTIISYSRGQNAAEHTPKVPKFNIGQVVGSVGTLTFLDDGERRRHYTGTIIGPNVFSTEGLARMLARGVAHIERPVNLLGMILLQFVTEGKVELAESLEAWMEENDIEVLIPELIDDALIAEEPEMPPVGIAVTGDEEED